MKGFINTLARNKPLHPLLVVVVVLGTAFQAGHFYEHTMQAYQWVFVERTFAYMSPLAHWLAMRMGPTMASGMEVLHLVGNGIFLTTLGAYVLLQPSNHWLRRAWLVEAFHLSEHIALTVTVFEYGHSVGWSTLWGAAPWLFGDNGAVGFRVLWHFGMNLVPTGLMLYGMLHDSSTGRRLLGKPRFSDLPMPSPLTGYNGIPSLIVSADYDMPEA